MMDNESTEIEEIGDIRKYELLPKRKLYIAVYKMVGGGYYSSSNENKADLIKLLHSTYGLTDIKVYTVDIGD